MKKEMRNLIFTVLLFAATLTSAQTMHVIVVCNTQDKNIGTSVMKDLEIVKSKTQDLANILDYDFTYEELSGSKCTRANLKAAIDDLEVTNEDVVLTYYSGHGSHAMNDNDPWPQYCMNTGFENQGNWVPMALLDKWVAAKNPRLRIIIADCCNKESSATTIKPKWMDDGKATIVNKANVANYQKLFSAKGSVMVTSSKLGQYSFCGNIGGFFTNDFWDVMQMVGNGHVAADWQSMLTKVASLTGGRTIRTDTYPYTATQNPYFVVDASGSFSTIVGDGTNGIETIERSLATLSNKKLSLSERQAMIPQIKAKHFGGVKYIVIVGNDLTTNVDREEVDVYLQRICLSEEIVGVSVVKRTESMVKVHEVRKK